MFRLFVDVLFTLLVVPQLGLGAYYVYVGKQRATLFFVLAVLLMVIIGFREVKALFVNYIRGKG